MHKLHFFVFLLPGKSPVEVDVNCRGIGKLFDYSFPIPWTDAPKQAGIAFYFSNYNVLWAIVIYKVRGRLGKINFKRVLKAQYKNHTLQ